MDSGTAWYYASDITATTSFNLNLTLCIGRLIISPKIELHPLTRFPPKPSTTTAGVENVTKLNTTLRRYLAAISTSANFAFALHFSNLSDARRVISFLLLPVDRAFDPSLAYLAIGALPLATLLYQLRPEIDKPRLGGSWSIPTSRKIDLTLVFGAVVFGMGWGLGGICRGCHLTAYSCVYLPQGVSAGPGLVNLGRALATGSGIKQVGVWVGSVGLGGLLVYGH